MAILLCGRWHEAGPTALQFTHLLARFLRVTQTYKTYLINSFDLCIIKLLNHLCNKREMRHSYCEYEVNSILNQLVHINSASLSCSVQHSCNQNNTDMAHRIIDYSGHLCTLLSILLMQVPEQNHSIINQNSAKFITIYIWSKKDILFKMKCI